MSELKVVGFKKPEPVEDQARLPTEEEMKALLGGKKLKSVFMIVANEDGVTSHYFDHFPLLEMLGAIEVSKAVLINPDIEEEL